MIMSTTPINEIPWTIDEGNIEISSYTLRKLLLGLLRTHLTTTGNYEGILKEVLSEFYWDRDHKKRTLQVELIDTPDSDLKKLDYDTGVYIADKDIAYAAPTVGARASDDLVSGESGYVHVATYNYAALIQMPHHDEVACMSDNFYYFLGIIKHMFSTGCQDISDLKINNASGIVRTKRGYVRSFSFSLEASASYQIIPETHLFRSVDIRYVMQED